MADLSSKTPQQLFSAWRDGDAAAGQAMAQRFSDWYYAVTAARLGDLNGRVPLQRACTRFQQGIVGVADAKSLSDWAHKIVADEVGMAGGRIAGGDFPNVLTAGRSPTEILREARGRLPNEQVRLLSHAYDSSFGIEQVTRECEAMGGYPYAVLKARADLKRVLRNDLGVAFTEVPDKPNLDSGPLPLYEAGRMTNPNEESGFEKWLLTNLGLCKDIAEFGVFALALRAGAFAGSSTPQSAIPTVIPPQPGPAPAAPATPARPAAPTPSSPAEDPFADPPERSSSGLLFAVVVGGLLLLLGVVVIALVAWKYLV